MRMTDIAAGGRPLDKAKMVSGTRPQANIGATTGATWPAPS